MTRDAELKARDFVALVMSAVATESEVGVAQRLLLQTQTALGSYADPGWAAENGWPAFADTLLDRARESAAGFGPSAGVRQRAVHVGAVTQPRRRAGRPCWTTNPQP